MARTEETKLDLFLQWLQVNGAQFRGCNIKYCDSTKGFNIFSSNDSPKDGVLLVVPLDLAITPMRVLQDPLIGAECRAIFQEGQVDDMFLMILFLTVERLRKNSSWKPYLDMLPTTFGNPLWFTDDEMLELRGTILYRATELRKKDLISVYEDKVKGLVKKLLALDGVSERSALKISFGRDLLKMNSFLFSLKMGVNSIFWSRALNLSLPHSYVFPQIQEDTETTCPVERSSEVTISHSGLSGESVNEIDGKDLRVMRMITKSMEKLPNRNKKKLSRRRRVFSLVLTFATMVYLKAVATWEVHVPKRDCNWSSMCQVVGSNKEWKPKVINSNFGKGSGTAGASDVPTSSVEVNAHSQPVSRVLDSEEATSKLQKKLEELHLRSYNLLVSSCDNLRTFLVFCFQIAIGICVSSAPIDDA
ncbi:hypothetical protein F3Y22_tig00111213pilonHSYRG00234 [Hibiscus syriacus]|uniref:SET domain-containing protein n=1 Tax=Hibiscus syriacus TaxID=106335 RepID=A0A6A2YUM2_HIBSY|nr:hypothetical protein F3Y22_tig00111213pilonHSYRG00234 [Hibiscus syriacus]